MWPPNRESVPFMHDLFISGIFAESRVSEKKGKTWSMVDKWSIKRRRTARAPYPGVGRPHLLVQQKLVNIRVAFCSPRILFKTSTRARSEVLLRTALLLRALVVAHHYYDAHYSMISVRTCSYSTVLCPVREGGRCDAASYVVDVASLFYMN